MSTDSKLLEYLLFLIFLKCKYAFYNFALLFQLLMNFTSKTT